MIVVRGSLFQGNQAGLQGGGLFLQGAVDLLYNQFISNQSGSKGGGVYQGETSTKKNVGQAYYDGNLFQGNMAEEGGGMYLEPVFSPNLIFSYSNLALINNQANTTGGAIAYHRYASGWTNFEHLTLAGNTAGDGTMVMIKMGNTNFTNTILYSGTIGIKSQDKVTLDHALIQHVTTPVTATWNPNYINILNPISGDPGFAADGYHLGSASAAIDAGAEAGVTHDIDGAPRPYGSAPDLGADESPYARTPGGMQASKLASDPRWRAYLTMENAPPSTFFEQEYLLPFAYQAVTTAPLVTSYQIKDLFPSSLGLYQVVSQPVMTYSYDSGNLTWNSPTPLSPGGWGWIGLTGRTDNVIPGSWLTNTARMTYTLASGQSYNISMQAGAQVPPRPILPPVILSPSPGEMCPDPGGGLPAFGVAGAGSIVRLYENGVLKATSTADASGVFTLTWQSALDKDHAVSIYAKACEPGGSCSLPSRSIRLSPPQSYWCPQRSYWEGDVGDHHYVFYFRDENGLYTSDLFLLPGVYGFWNTLLHLYSCCDSESNPFRVIADGNEYLTPVSHEGRFFTFNIGGAHNVEIEAKCQVGQGEPPDVKITRGEVLIDPDGFVFDSAYGGSYDPQTGMFDPVQPVQGVTVTAYVSVPEWGGWTMWPAHLFNNQVNPQVTGADGYFAFFTPPGQYYLQASEAGGFQSWRSPLIEVITQVVHRNIPLTQFGQGDAAHVTLSPSGLSQAKVNVPPGSMVEWRSALDAAGTASQLASLNANPIGRLLSSLDPLTNPLSFDSGTLIPGSIYQRQFITPGLYTYSDGWGHNGQVVVSEQRLVYLPLTIRKR